MRKEDKKETAALYAKIYDRVNIGEHWTRNSAQRLLHFWLQKQPDLCFVAIVDKKIIGGFLGGIKPWWDGNHLVDGEVFVDYAFHKKGIGTALSKKMYKTALDKYRITSIDLVTFSKGGFPLSWYQSLGFKTNDFLKMISGKPKKALKKLGALKH